ncbi:MAG: nucleotide exchange factor GrpE [Solirubrobacterales bacterium]
MSASQDDSRTDERPPAGPVAAGDPPPPARQEEVPPTTPPAGEAIEQDIDALPAEAQQERDEYLELAQRTKADFENFRKRVAADIQAATLRGKAEVAREIVPVIDHFELALQHSGIDSVAALANKSQNATEAGWAMTFSDLHKALNRIGVEVVDPKGEKFDPNFHEALSTQPVDGTESGVVVEVMQKGYMLGDQLIRPARVVVSA